MNLEQENLLKEQVKKRERLAREIYIRIVSNISEEIKISSAVSSSFILADSFMRVAEEERNK